MRLWCKRGPRVRGTMRISRPQTPNRHATTVRRETSARDAPMVAMVNVEMTSSPIACGGTFEEDRTDRTGTRLLRERRYAVYTSRVSVAAREAARFGGAVLAHGGTRGLARGRACTPHTGCIEHDRNS